MPFTVESSSDRTFIVVRHSGDVAIAELDELLRQLKEAVGGEVPMRCLIDLRAATSYPSKPEFSLWLRGRHPGAAFAVHTALLAKAGLLEVAQFAALASRNSGRDVKAFDKEQDALLWLLSNGPKPA